MCRRFRIGRYQLLTMLEEFPGITTVYLYDLNRDRASHLAAELESLRSVTYVATDSAEEAVRVGDVVITATVTDKHRN